VSSARLNDFFDVLDDELGWRLIAGSDSHPLEFSRIPSRASVRDKLATRDNRARPRSKYFQKSEKRLVSFLNIQ